MGEIVLKQSGTLLKTAFAMVQADSVMKPIRKTVSRRQT